MGNKQRKTNYKSVAIDNLSFFINLNKASYFMFIEIRIRKTSTFYSTIARLKKATLDFQFIIGLRRICSEPQNQGSLKSDPFFILYNFTVPDSSFFSLL